jgi:amino acid adenylation domain-containing protein
MIEKLLSSFTTNADKIAIFSGGKAFTYGELASKVGFLQQLMKKETGQQQKVGVIANDDLGTYASIISCLLSGISFVPIDPAHPSERNKSVVIQSGIRCILDSLERAERSLPFSEDEVKVIFTGGEPAHSYVPEYHNLQESNQAYILFTSGTTGIPKGVPVSRNNLNSFLEAVFSGSISISADDRFMQVFDLTFDLSVYSLLVPLIAGATLYSLPKKGVRYTAAIAMIEEHKITHVLTVPSFVSLLRPYFSEIRLPQIRTWLFCGEALKADMVQEWMTCLPNAQVFNVYGPTEATIFCSASQIEAGKVIKEHHGIVSIGKPFSGVRFIILDEEGNEAGIGVSGELCISGKQTTTGYLGNEELNRTAFVELPMGGGQELFYRTGDLAYYDEAGDFYFIGRKDTQIKIQGFRVELGEIENAANKQDGVMESVALAEPDKRGFPVIYLFLRGSTIQKEGLINSLRLLLPEYMMPRQVWIMDDFPLNLNGKIDKNELRKLINT